MSRLAEPTVVSHCCSSLNATAQLCRHILYSFDVKLIDTQANSVLDELIDELSSVWRRAKSEEFVTQLELTRLQRQTTDSWSVCES